MAGIAPSIIYQLKCGHAAMGPSSLVSGMLGCPWHQLNVPIVGVIVYEWRAKCDSCSYARWAGADRHTANIFVTGHIRRNRTHDVYPEYTQNPEAVSTLKKMERFGAIQSSSQS